MSEDYSDMVALENMTHEEASSYLQNVYRRYINRYISPDEHRDYSEGDYDSYAIQCAFRIAYKALGGKQWDWLTQMNLKIRRIKIVV